MDEACETEIKEKPEPLPVVCLLNKNILTITASAVESLQRLWLIGEKLTKSCLVLYKALCYNGLNKLNY